MSEQKTEAPTDRRRHEARKKGEGIGRSHELTMGITLGVGLMVITSIAPGVVTQLSALMRGTIIEIGSPSALSHTQLVDRIGGSISQSVFFVLPLAAAVILGAVISSMAAGGFVVSMQRIKPDLKRLNPLSGMKRIADKQALFRLGIAVVKLTVVSFMAYQVIGTRIPILVGLQGASASALAGGVWDAIFQLGLMLTMLLGVIALADFIVQRRRALNSIKMTKQEVRYEMRDQEGDPQVKGARRRRARQMAFGRMMDAVKTADVVVTNPTHLAVALKYDSLTMKAPRIVAKGQRLTALRIKEVAKKSGVLIIEDKPLARALFTRPINSDVPPDLYRAVARLLVLVHQARFGMRAHLQPEARA